MAAAWIVEPVDILEDSPFCLATCGLPDQQVSDLAGYDKTAAVSGTALWPLVLSGQLEPGRLFW